MAELGPAEAAVLVRLGELPAILEGLPHLDLVDAERFALDLEEGRKAVGLVPPVPWGS